MTTRRDQLAEALTRVRGRVDHACRVAGRDPGAVRLLAVTKTFPASDVATLLDLGLTEFGESRDQEAAPKAVEVATLRPDVTPRFEMVGRLQRNKVRSVARWAEVVHSVDSGKLSGTLDRASRLALAEGSRNTPLTVLIQISLDPAPVRGGVPPSHALELAELVAAGELRLGGVMGLAPRTGDPELAFATLAETAAQVRAAHPEATEISAGMSGDLDLAIKYGSTCVRVGTALLGTRDLALP